MLESDVHAERVVSRAWRDAKAQCLSFRGYVASGLGLAVAAACGAVLSAGREPWEIAAVTLAAGLAGLVVVIALAFAASIVVAPVRQRDEARRELHQITQDLAAPVALSIEYQPQPPVVLASGGSGRVSCFLNIQNNHRDDISGVVLNFDVPRDVKFARVDGPGRPYSGDNGRSGSSTRGDRHHWLEKDIELPGDGWVYRVSFILAFTEAGARDIMVKLRIPGFASVNESFVVEAVRPASSS